MIVDVHAHLDFVQNLSLILKNAELKNVKIIITNSVDLNSCKRNLKISKKNKIVKLAIGLYPQKDISLEKYALFEKWIKKNKKSVFAIGEIGLDLHHTEKNFDLQKKIFIKQLNLARELKIPAIVHTRKAEKEAIQILEKYTDIKILLHCFSGNFKLIKKAEDLGFYFSIPTNIVRSEHFQKMVKELQKEKILTETDSPYLSPFKEIQNEPRFISESIKKISKIWKISKEKTENQIEKNYEKLFGIDV